LMAPVPNVANLGAKSWYVNFKDCEYYGIAVELLEKLNRY